jgi:hypothetical protein
MSGKLNNAQINDIRKGANNLLAKIKTSEQNALKIKEPDKRAKIRQDGLDYMKKFVDSQKTQIAKQTATKLLTPAATDIRNKMTKDIASVKALASAKATATAKALTSAGAAAAAKARALAAKKPMPLVKPPMPLVKTPMPAKPPVNNIMQNAMTKLYNSFNSNINLKTKEVNAAVQNITGSQATVKSLSNQASSIIYQISRIYKLKQPKLMSKLSELKECLLMQFFEISMLYPHRKLVIILDSLDQLDPADYSLSWLIEEFPSNIKMIYSCLPTHGK